MRRSIRLQRTIRIELAVIVISALTMMLAGCGKETPVPEISQPIPLCTPGPAEGDTTNAIVVTSHCIIPAEHFKKPMRDTINEVNQALNEFNGQE